MSITKLQDKPVIIGSPIEIEFAVNEIRKVLSGLPWLDRPYFIAQRFFRKEGGKAFSFPETYAPESPGLRNYKRLTPDNDFKGMCFFMVGSNKNDFKANQQNFLTYSVSIIFSVNLELIDKVKLNQGLFTQELIRDVRRLLTNTMMNHEFDYVLKSETRDLKECFREFVLDDIESYNRAPMQCFRFEMDVRVQEDCF
jgi:hypothetical protein